MSHAKPVTRRQPEPYGLLVEFETEEAVTHAAETVRDAGYKQWDVLTPYPVHGMEQAMGLGHTHLPWLVLGGGIFGCLGALALQLFANWIDYPFLISGKPFASIPAFVPVCFECTVLIAGITAFVSVFLLSGLPMLYHPLFTSERFVKGASDDRFFILIETADPSYDAEKTRELAESLGGTSIEMLED